MSIIDRARSWLAQDPDPETRREFEALIDRGDIEALEDRFDGELEFGTAGLRGLLGAGPRRMNRVTVARTTAGLCAWLKQEVPEVVSRGICVGRDARLNSDVFEREVIEVAAGAGIPVWTFSDVVPTPIVAFAVLELRAAGGVMITASHNPPGYNGYKVYWENGAQIIPPNDHGIADEIRRSPTADEIPRLSLDDARDKELLRTVDSLRDEYVERIAAMASRSEARAEVRVAYTALHGVAEDTFRKVLAGAGFEDVHSVSEQAAPDGRFPTVAFPNPEEPGAMDRVLALAERVDADLAIANDPDGDRVAVAVRGEGGFELLSGNDIGLLLADDLLHRYQQAGQPVVISTVVSSPMLAPLATLWGALGTNADRTQVDPEPRPRARAGRLLLCIRLRRGPRVRALTRRARQGWDQLGAPDDRHGRAPQGAQGETLLDARDGLWRKHGFFADRQISTRFEGADAQARMSAVVDRYREAPPPEIGGQRVVRMLDLERQCNGRRWG